MPHQPSTTTRIVTRLEAAKSDERDDQLAIEEPLEIRVNAHAIAVTMRTPGHDVDLAAGFCLTEGIVDSGDDIDSIEPCSEADYGNIVGVQLTPEATQHRAAAIEHATRQLTVTSSCGLCSKQTIDQTKQRVKKLQAAPSSPRVQPDQLHAMAQIMRDHQKLFDQTGAIHAAAVFSAVSELRVLREDIGRHNAVDKTIGHLLMRDQLRKDDILFVSGRAGFEIVQKAARAQIGIVCAVGAPSSMAVDFANEVGQTLIGFLRESRMNIYTHRDRIVE